MSQSNSYQGQILIMKDLKKIIEDNITYLKTFSSDYKDKIDQCESLNMMSEYISVLKKEGLPYYEKRVEESIKQLEYMKLAVLDVIKELEDRMSDRVSLN